MITTWPIEKEAGRNGRAGKLWKVENSKEVGFKARKKLIARKRECALQGGGVVCVRIKGSEIY